MKHLMRALLGILISLQLLAQNPYGIVIHGGAGTINKENTTPELATELETKLKEALDCGYSILNQGGTSLDAVEAAIRILEDSPLFNAGKGAVYTYSETHELDASIMDGNSLQAGAVSGVSQIKNPISLARKVMENSPHVMLSGAGALEFGKSQHLEIVPSEYFSTDRRLKALREMKSQQVPENKHGTVGAVALDQSGNLAAGTSTGGMTGKRYGRIGDSPIIGAGTYAKNSTCAVSCTGHGEFFIRSVVAYDMSALMEYQKLTAQQAADLIIHKKLFELGGSGGIIAIDQNANPVMEFNTPGMYRACKTSKGVETILFFSKDLL